MNCEDWGKKTNCPSNSLICKDANNYICYLPDKICTYDGTLDKCTDLVTQKPTETPSTMLSWKVIATASIWSIWAVIGIVIAIVFIISKKNLRNA